MNLKSIKNQNKCEASIIIIAQNEENNIENLLKSLVDHFDDIWVIDSYSEDDTVVIAKKFGVNILTNQFTHWASQRNWALANAKLKYNWILFLDADEQVTELFCKELQDKITLASPKIAGMNVFFQYYFLGSPIRFSYESPPVIRLIRKGRAVWEGEGAREYAKLDGELDSLNNKLIHWDKKGLAAWTAKHIRNALREVNEKKLLPENRLAGDEGVAKTLERPGRRKIRRKVWNRLPMLLRPLAYFIYRYVLRGGILDGKAGFAYCFLHALWYPMMIDLMLLEKLKEKQSP